jgi:hypothetical protein
MERSGSVANVNSHRVSSKGSTISTNKTVKTQYNTLERKADLIYTGVAVG